MRNYDPQTGRFNCVDVLAEKTWGVSPYQYGFNNPVFFNDPTGALTKAEFDKLIETLWGSNYGGHWSAKENTGTFEYGGGSYSFFGSADEAFGAGAGLMADNGWWGLNKGWATNFESALQAYNGGKFTPGMVTGYYMQKWESQQAYNISSDYSPNGKGFNTVYNTEYIGTMENVTSLYSSMQQMIRLFGGYFGGGGKKEESLSPFQETIEPFVNNALDPAVTAGNQIAKRGTPNGISVNMKAMKGISHGTVATTIVLGAIKVRNGYKMDGNHFGYNAQSATARTIGAIGGAALGAEIGAAVGVWFFGVGAVPAAIVGALIGSWFFGEAGSSAGQSVVDSYYEP